MSKSKIRSLAENSAFSAVFGGMEFRAARRAKENSPAIHRWDTGYSRQGQSPAGTTGVFYSKAREQRWISFVPPGLRTGSSFFLVPAQTGEHLNLFHRK